MSAGSGMADYAACASHHLSAGEKRCIPIATVLAIRSEMHVMDESAAQAHRLCRIYGRDIMADTSGWVLQAVSQRSSK